MTLATAPAAFVDADAVGAVLDLHEAIDAIRAAYAEPVDPMAMPPRTVAHGAGARLRTHTGSPATGGLMGAKLVAHPPQGGPTYLMVLFDQHDGRLAGLLDAHAITAARTAATTAVAVDLLAPARPLALGVLGSGHEARAHVRALAAVRTIAALRVFSPRAERRTAFAAWARDELGLPADAAGGAQEVVERADTVVAAARAAAEKPVLDGAWLPGDALVASIGSTLPAQRELDVESLRRCALLVADDPEEVLHNSGDGLAAQAQGVDLGARTRSLHDLVAGRLGDLARGPGIRVFKSVGSAVQDLAVATLVLRRAIERGLAVPTPVHLPPKER